MCCSDSISQLICILTVSLRTWGEMLSEKVFQSSEIKAFIFSTPAPKGRTRSGEFWVYCWHDSTAPPAGCEVPCSVTVHASWNESLPVELNEQDWTHLVAGCIDLLHAVVSSDNGLGSESSVQLRQNLLLGCSCWFPDQNKTLKRGIHVVWFTRCPY